MTRLEDDLRSTLRSIDAAPPPHEPGLEARVLRGVRGRRRTVTGLVVAGTVAAAVALAMLTLGREPGPDAPVATEQSGASDCSGMQLRRAGTPTDSLGSLHEVAVVISNTSPEATCVLDGDLALTLDSNGDPAQVGTGEVPRVEVDAGADLGVDLVWTEPCVADDARLGLTFGDGTTLSAPVVGDPADACAVAGAPSPRVRLVDAQLVDDDGGPYSLDLGGWQRIRHAGVVLLVPSSWVLADPDACQYTWAHWGPPGTGQCADDFTGVTFYGSSTFDPANGPGPRRVPAETTGGEPTWAGYVLKGSQAVYVVAPERAVAERVLGSANATGR